VHYDDMQIRALRYGLYISAKQWMSGLQQFEVINDLLYEDPSTLVIKTRFGKCKLLMDCTRDEVDWRNYFDNDFYYSNISRFSMNCNNTMYYGLQYPNHTAAIRLMGDFYQLVSPLSE
jgi:hypothetical protein